MKSVEWEYTLARIARGNIFKKWNLSWVLNYEKENHIPGIRNSKDKGLDLNEFGMFKEKKEMLCVLNIIRWRECVAGGEAF